MTADSSKPISLHCPKCNHKLRLEIEHIGVKGACVSCNAPIMGIEQAPSEYTIELVDEQNLLSSTPANHSQVREEHHANGQAEPKNEMFLAPSPPPSEETQQQIPEQATELGVRTNSPFTKSQSGENSFDKKAEPSTKESNAPETSEITPRSFMDDETVADENNLSAFSGVSNSSDEATSLTDISGSAQVVQGKLKKNRVKRPSIGAPLITAIMLTVIIGGCSVGYKYAPIDTKTAINGQLAEWLEPGKVVIGKLPLGLNKKILNFIETSLPTKHSTAED